MAVRGNGSVRNTFFFSEEEGAPKNTIRVPKIPLFSPGTSGRQESPSLGTVLSNNKDVILKNKKIYSNHNYFSVFCLCTVLCAVFFMNKINLVSINILNTNDIAFIHALFTLVFFFFFNTLKNIRATANVKFFFTFGFLDLNCSILL